MRAITLIIWLTSCLYCAGQNQVCISIDDLPVVHHGITDPANQKDIFTRIRKSFQKHNVPAIGFVNEGKLYDNEKIIPYQVELLKNWVSSGLELGNHTYSHLDYNNVSFSRYTHTILKGEVVIKKILDEQNKHVRYFRHPYLHTGSTKARADSLTDFLNRHHYEAAPVTIDNEDYLFALAYTRAKQNNDTALMHTIGKDYLEYMEKKILHYERQSHNLFNRNISQILLLHASLLNADYLDALLMLYKKHHYSFISMKEALEDPAYQTPVTVFGTWGISWIDRWALSIGKKELLKEDPETPDYIRKLAE